MRGCEGALVEGIDRVNSWVLTELASLNQDILARRRPAGDLSAALRQAVLAGLPPPESLSPQQAQQLVVLLGLAGASVGTGVPDAVVAVGAGTVTVAVPASQAVKPRASEPTARSAAR